MTNIQYHLAGARDYLSIAEAAERKEDSETVKFGAECAIAQLRCVLEVIECDNIVNVCQYCGEESEDDHIGAICLKG